MGGVVIPFFCLSVEKWEPQLRQTNNDVNKHAYSGANVKVLNKQNLYGQKSNDSNQSGNFNVMTQFFNDASIVQQANLAWQANYWFGF